MYNKEYEKLKEAVILLFNNEMEKEGSCLRFIEDTKDMNIQSYKLVVLDKYIDNTYAPAPNLTDEGERKIREFIEKYGVKFQFTNTVRNVL